MRYQLGLIITIILLQGSADGQYAAAESKIGDKPSWYHKQIAGTLLREGNFQQAVSEYQKALASTPSSDTYFNLAIAYYQAGQIDRAVAALQRVVKLSPNDAEAWYNLACLSLYRQNAEDAVEYFRQAKRAEAEPKLGSLIDQGLLFVEKLQKQSPPFQRAVLTLLQLGSLTSLPKEPAA